MRGPVEDIHHLIAHAQLVVGESATMSSEAAVLGVPAVFIATTGRGYTDDQERRYGLVRHFTEDQYDMRADRDRGDARRARVQLGRRARQRLLDEKIDVTAWMIDYFECTFAAMTGRFMCGIAGTCGFGDDELVRAMTDTIAHRGPDGEGFYVGDGVHLGNRRLAIQDVPGGAQPMANEDGSVVVVYNGEIYNYPELRDVVLARGHRLKTHCDTEILPHLYEDEGIDFAARLNGIFAFALLRPRPAASCSWSGTRSG